MGDPVGHGSGQMGFAHPIGAAQHHRLATVEQGLQRQGIGATALDLAQRDSARLAEQHGRHLGGRIQFERLQDPERAHGVAQHPEVGEAIRRDKEMSEEVERTLVKAIGAYKETFLAQAGA